MKTLIPTSLVVPGHPDFEVLNELAEDMVRRAGGPDSLALGVAGMLRECIDDVIQTPRTGRRSYDELEKTEKTYIGTRVEIMLRAMLGLPKGRLDAVIRGRDVDIKHTMGNNWMIPVEAIDHPCILVAADEERAACYLGIFVARLENLTLGANRDAKRSVSAAGFANILWLLRAYPYPSNFWRAVNPKAVERIFSGASGNARVMALFREIQGIPISRDVVEAVARQKDFMRRIRADGGRGTRDNLAREGVLLLSGDFDAGLIAKLGLPFCEGSVFISHVPKSEAEAIAARVHGLNVRWPIS